MPVSIGLAPNKTLAKIASKLAKKLLIEIEIGGGRSLIFKKNQRPVLRLLGTVSCIGTKRKTHCKDMDNF
jgi:hypothetical protein